MSKPRAKTPPITVTTEAQRELLLIKPPLAALAASAGVSKMSASRWARGEDRPGFLARAAIESAFGVPGYLWAFAPARSEAHRLAYHGMSAEQTDPALFARLLETTAGLHALADIVRRRTELGSPEPSPLERKQQDTAPAPPPPKAKPARNLDAPRPEGTAGKLYAFTVRCVHREVDARGLDAGTAVLRGRSVPQWAIDAALAEPKPAPRD